MGIMNPTHGQAKNQKPQNFCCHCSGNPSSKACGTNVALDKPLILSGQEMRMGGRVRGMVPRAPSSKFAA